MNDRTTFIGGTDISAILGENPWRTPFSVWREKLGEGQEIPDNPSMEWGRRSEPMIAEKFCEDHNMMIATAMPQSLIHALYPFLGGTVDRWVTDSAGKLYGLEIKTAQSSQSWKDNEPPMHYWMQCQWYCGIARSLKIDVDKWHLAALFHGNDYQEYVIDFDEVWFKDTEMYAVGWWQKHVIDKEPVELDHSDAAKAFVAEQYTKSDATILPAAMLSDIDKNLVEQYIALKKQVSMDEITLDTLQNQIMNIIGNNKGVALDNGASVTWVRSKPTTTVSWKDVATACNPSQDILDKYSKTGAGRSYLKITGIEE